MTEATPTLLLSFRKLDNKRMIWYSWLMQNNKGVRIQYIIQYNDIEISINLHFVAFNEHHKTRCLRVVVIIFSDL